MKILLTSTLLAATVSILPVQAASYQDTVGETITAGILDISSVEVNNTATSLSFKINLADDPIATDWGKYMIGIDAVPGGDTTGNGWARPISMPSGMDYFLGGWVDWGNGAEIRVWNGTGWDLRSATYSPNLDNLAITKDASSVTFTFDFAGLGLLPGTSFLFDVYTSGGGGSDTAIDAAANPLQSVAAWDQPYASGQLLSYTVTVIPEPTAASLLILGGLLLFGRRKA